jgi:hypothetical protein
MVTKKVLESKMGSRGKKSFSELSTMKTVRITAIKRPDPAEDMTIDQEYKKNKRYIHIRIKVPNIPSHRIFNRNSGKLVNFLRS